jgi:ATP-dependent helicase HepA
MSDSYQYFVLDDEHGVGRVTDPSAPNIVTFFQGPGSEEIQIDCGPLPIYTPEPRTRVWIPPQNLGDRWRSGTLNEPFESSFWIDLPNFETRTFPVSQIRINCSNWTSSPLDFLIEQACETPFWAERRFGAIDVLLRQKARIADLGGIWTSGVELHEHQVNTARRILLDPVQRYLLADEVGLGKTIEAGMVIRQYLIDFPSGTVVVAVPSELRDQWSNELRSKFRIDDFPEAQISILSHELLGEVKRIPGILVIDEVHRIAKHPLKSTADEQKLYESLATLSSKAERVLLLSATPVRSSESNYLAILHLLSPESYPLDDVAGFLERVAVRNQLGERLLELKPDMPAFLADRYCNGLKEVIPSDPQLHELIDEYARSIIEEQPIEVRELATTRVRNHISETHRIHRRMIRNRRSGRVLKEFPLRGRRLQRKLINEDSDKQHSSWLLLDELRADLRNQVANDSISRSEAVARLREILALLSSGVSVDYGDESIPSELRIAGQGSLRRLPETNLGAIEKLIEFFADLRTSRGGTDKRKKIIFASRTSDALIAYQLFLEKWGKNHVRRILQCDSEVERAQNLTEFWQQPGPMYLICDSTIEEGFNLQHADMIAFVGVPWSTGVVEQRIGRLDRYCPDSEHPVEIVVVISDDELENLWFQFLEDSGVFDDSVATLQYALTTIEEQLLEKLLFDGVEAFREELPKALESIDIEKVAIKREDLLDGVELDDLSQDDFFSQLAMESSDSTNFGSALQAWFEALRINSWSENRRLSFGYSQSKPPFLTNNSLFDFVPELWDSKGSFFRHVVLENPGTRMLGIGDRIIDATLKFALEDDRGRAYARRIIVDSPRLQTMELLFRFDFFIILDFSKFQESINSTELRLLAKEIEGRFGSHHFVKWISPYQDTPRQELIDLAMTPYVKDDSSGRDKNLGGSGWDEFQLRVKGVDWPRVCRDSHEQALRNFEKDKTLANLVDKSLKSIRQQLDKSIAILNSRVSVDFSVEKELARLVELKPLILDAVSNPIVHLDSCGAVFLVPRRQ